MLFVKNICSRMTDIDSYGIVSICLFVAVFVAAVLLAVFMRKSLVTTMSHLPLADDEGTTTVTGKLHE
jgi:hypothetical protein